MNDLAADHRACAEVLRASASSFAAPIALLPVAKRRGTTALYAFCRRADDIVDDAADPATARQALAAFAVTVAEALDGGRVDDPVVRALADTVRRFGVPRGSIDAILEGVRMDLDRNRYETFADLEEYCRRVASAVGVAAIHIWGFTDPAAVAVAHDVGLAFQLTNILRDVPEDLARGRIYLPAADFRAAGCTMDDLIAGRSDPGFSRLAALECDRAAACFARGARLDRMLTTDGRMAWRAMFGVYWRLFAAVRRAGPAIFTARVRPGRVRLLAAALTTTLLGPVPHWRRSGS
jgi:phytoene synthase